MINVLCVGVGGLLGSVLRYGAGLAVGAFFPKPFLLWATLGVNVLGSFLIGYCASIFKTYPTYVSLFIITGFLGGFTTFSAFSLETLLLLKESRYVPALVNVSLHFVLCLSAVWIGFSLSRSV